MTPAQAKKEWQRGLIELLALLPDCRWVEARDLLVQLAPVVKATRDKGAMKLFQWFAALAEYGVDMTPPPVVLDDDD
jgi:hypothetical protein